MSALALRPMKPTDLVKYSRVIAPRRFIGVMVVEDGEDIGCGVITWGMPRKAWMTMESSERLLKHPRMIVRVGKMLISAAANSGVPLYTIEDKGPKAAKLLHWLGFRDTGDKANGTERILIWKSS